MKLVVKRRGLMRSVIVLLSTYNGERYLRQQIDSLLNQKNVSLRILARDDGSNDATMSILKEYADKHDIFSYYQGENCGPAKSFLDLISKAEKADYYALCDQDDIWEINHLEVLLSNIGDKSFLKYYN